MGSGHAYRADPSQTTIGLPGRLSTIAAPGAPRPSVLDYQLVKVIGRGAFGTVWLAEEPLAGTFRAVKVLDAARRDRLTPIDDAARHGQLADVERSRGPSRIDHELDGLHAYQSRAAGHPHLIQVLKTGLCTIYPLPPGEGRDEGGPALPPGEGRVAAGGLPGRVKGEPRTVAYYVMEIADHAGGPRPHKPADYEPLTLATLLRQRGRLPVTVAIPAVLRDQRTGKPTDPNPWVSGSASTSSRVPQPTPLGVVEIALALLDAIAHLQDAGLQHRDVKPANVLFVGGVLKLADMGLVSTDSDEAVGTPGYLPPAVQSRAREQAAPEPSRAREQALPDQSHDPNQSRDREGAEPLADARGSDFTQRPSDLYALGKVMYEMLTGLPATAFPEWPGDLGGDQRPGRGFHRPERGIPSPERERRVWFLRGRRPRADAWGSDWVRQLSALRRLINRLCHPDARERLTDLRACRAELLALAVPPRRPMVSRRWAAAILAIALPLAILGGGTSVQWWHDRQDPTKQSWATPPYDGSGLNSIQTGCVADGVEYALHRMHSPDQPLRINHDGGGRVEIYDVQSALVMDDRGRGDCLRIAGAYRIHDDYNALPRDVHRSGGEIEQLYLLVYERHPKQALRTKIALYHGEPGASPGMAGRFGRSIPLKELVSAPEGELVVVVWLGRNLDPADAERRLDTELRLAPADGTKPLAVVLWRPENLPPPGPAAAP